MKFTDKEITISVRFPSQDWAYLHDVVIDVTGESCNQQKLEEIFNKLPLDIKCIAIQWSMSDTVFRDEVYKYLEMIKLRLVNNITG